MEARDELVVGYIERNQEPPKLFPIAVQFVMVIEKPAKEQVFVHVGFFSSP